MKYFYHVIQRFVIGFVFFVSLVHSTARADEGLWIPLLLEQLNESDMQSMGLKLTAEDIYSINKSSIKDAIVLFGGGCTAELISDQGLILTNHHCGYSSIQSHSSVQNDYLTNGYWAMTRQDELTNPGLSVTFLVRMEDVTQLVLDKVTTDMTDTKRKTIITENIERIEKTAVKGTNYKAKIKPFFYGNEYYMFITEVFKDIRLVGAPPSDIGKFGGDTDNWMWPRHTGDFSMFRIYCDKDNNPAEYSKDNVPYKPKQSLTISLKGVKEGDFTMVYGYPGTTEEYLTSHAVQMISEVENPAKIELRAKRLDILNECIKKSDLVRIQYSAKYAGIANYWKKWIGETRGLKKLNAIEKKQQSEKDFTMWVNEDKSRIAKYNHLLEDFQKVYAEEIPLNLAFDYFYEAGVAIEIVKYAYTFTNLVNKSNDASTTADDLAKIVDNLNKGAKGYFKNYNAEIDKKIFVAMLSTYYQKLDKSMHPDIFLLVEKKYKGNFQKYADYVYAGTAFASEASINLLLKDYKPSSAKKILKDPAFILAQSIYKNYIDHIMPRQLVLDEVLDSLNRIYIKALREMYSDKKFYPDANSTMRLAYGKVASYKPNDGVEYNYYTTLDGMIEKEDPKIDDYKVPAKLKQLYESKDYGAYAEDGKMHIAFIASNHTSGGNSGSPVLNGKGELIGVNFDRVWEGTMSDIMFDPTQCRNITLDIRFVLFIVDKYAGASHLIKELKIAE